MGRVRNPGADANVHAAPSHMRVPGAVIPRATDTGHWGRAIVGLCTALLLVAACAASPGSSSPAVAPSHTDDARARTDLDPVIRLVLVGDVMLGRDVADIVAIDPGSIFEQLRPVLVDADLAFANLESPLTTRPHATAGYALEADPRVAPLLAATGFDVVDLANNHATDAGPATVLDTLAATDAAGLRSVGAGADEAAASAPLVLDVDGVRVGILAFDMTGGGTAATAGSPGVNTWNRAAAEQAVTELRADVDLLVVGLHGGVEYLPSPDPVLLRAVEDLAGWGADVVWGHGAHVAYPATVDVGSRPAVLAPGLGNAVFDQQLPGTDEGAVLEVMADADGVLAARTGTVSIRAGRATFTGWHDPTGDAVALHGEWWTPARPVTDAPAGDCDAFDLDVVTAGLREGSMTVAASCGAVTDAGATEMAIAYRRPFTHEAPAGRLPGPPLGRRRGPGRPPRCHDAGRAHGMGRGHPPRPDRRRGGVLRIARRRLHDARRPDRGRRRRVGLARLRLLHGASDPPPDLHRLRRCRPRRRDRAPHPQITMTRGGTRR